MEDQTMFLVCPAYLDTDGARRCGLPAEVEARYTMTSTDGPLESAKIKCPRGHGFNGPIEFLTIQEQPTAAAASVTRGAPARSPGCTQHPDHDNGPHNAGACADSARADNGGRYSAPFQALPGQWRKSALCSVWWKAFLPWMQTL